MKLHVKKNQLHKDVGKAPGDKITEADIAKEKSKGGVYAKRAQFAENAKKWNHPEKGNGSGRLGLLRPQSKPRPAINHPQSRTSVPARRSCDKCADQPVAAKIRRLTRTTEPAILRLA
jgi:hypothetical protein